MLLPQGRVASGDITSNLFLWWKFDDGSGATASDSGSSGLSGALMNDFVSNPSWTITAAKIGTNCLSFGNGYAPNWVQNTTDFDLSGAITLSAWVYPVGSSNLAGLVVSLRDNVHSLHASLRCGDSGGLKLRIDGVSGSQRSASNVSPGAWYHLAGVYNNGALVTGYINGVATSTSDSTFTVFSNSPGVQVGCARVSNANQFDGAADDIRVYRRSLTQADITALVAYT